MSVFMSVRNPFRSAARCDRDGCTAMPTRTPAASTSSPAASNQRGVLRVGQAVWRIGTYGGSVRGGLCMAPPQPAFPAIRRVPVVSSACVTGP